MTPLLGEPLDALEPKAQTAFWGFLKWVGKVIGGAALGGVAGAFTFYTTWQGMQIDVRAQGETIKVHTAEIMSLQQADRNQALVMAVSAATSTAERKANEEQLRQIREDLQYLQRELIGRIRR